MWYSLAPRLHQGLIGSSCANLLPLQQLNTQACRNVVSSCRRAVEDQGKFMVNSTSKPYFSLGYPFISDVQFVDCHLFKKTYCYLLIFIVSCCSSLFLQRPRFYGWGVEVHHLPFQSLEMLQAVLYNHNIHIISCYLLHLITSYYLLHIVIT